MRRLEVDGKPIVSIRRLFAKSDRTLGLAGATGVGIGAMIGGGILALAGAAFASAGPSAILAFGLNGVIALLTALSFAEMASKFPESGGTDTFSRKVLTVESAFTVGWVVWFASMVAAVLDAIGFTHFAIVRVAELCVMCRDDAPQRVSEFVRKHSRPWRWIRCKKSLTSRDFIHANPCPWDSARSIAVIAAAPWKHCPIIVMSRRGGTTSTRAPSLELQRGKRAPLTAAE